MSMRLLYTAILALATLCMAQAANNFVLFTPNTNAIKIVGGANVNIAVSDADFSGVIRATKSLAADITEVSNCQCTISSNTTNANIIVGTLGKSDIVSSFVKKKKIDASLLKGKNEKYIITTISTGIKAMGRMLVA